MTRKLLMILVVFEFVGIIFLMTVLVLPKEIIGVFSGRYQIIKVE